MVKSPKIQGFINRRYLNSYRPWSYHRRTNGVRSTLQHPWLRLSCHQFYFIAGNVSKVFSTKTLFNDVSPVYCFTLVFWTKPISDHHFNVSSSMWSEWKYDKNLVPETGTSVTDSENRPEKVGTYEEGVLLLYMVSETPQGTLRRRSTSLSIILDPFVFCIIVMGFVVCGVRPNIGPHLITGQLIICADVLTFTRHRQT